MAVPVQRVDAIIFDLDGTLVDSEELGLQVIHDQAVALGASLPPEGVAAFRGKSMASNLEILSAALGRALPPDFETTLRAAMADVFRERLKPMPGALELLTALKVPYCIATNGPRPKAELTLGLTGLLPFFQDRLFSAYEVGSFKPEPGLFLAAAAAMNVSPAHCAVVEDSEPGMHAGIAAGMRVYAVPSPYPVPEALRQQVHMLGELRELLEQPWHPAN